MCHGRGGGSPSFRRKRDPNQSPCKGNRSKRGIPVISAENGCIILEIRLYFDRLGRSVFSEVKKNAETGEELSARKTVTDQTYGDTVTETAISIAGYNSDAETKDVKITIGTNEITFYYSRRTDLTYIVYYKENGTDTELAEQTEKKDRQ